MDYKQELEKCLVKANGMLTGLVLKNLEILTEYNINPKLLMEDSQFYIGICNRLLEKGAEVVDEVNFVSTCELYGLKEVYEKKGGWETVKNLKAIVDERNADSIVDDFNKWNLIKRYNEKGILDLEIHWTKKKR